MLREELAVRAAGLDAGLRAVKVDLGADDASALSRALTLCAASIDRNETDEGVASMTMMIIVPLREEVIRRQLMAAVEQTDGIDVGAMN